MKIRYLRVQNLPPLDDITLHFGHEPMLGRPVAIHFVVGVNGSGKSRVLQALAEIVLSTESLRWPDFPFSLVYDLGSAPVQTIIFHKPGHDNAEAAVFVLPRMADPVEGWTAWLARDWRIATQHPLGVSPSILGKLDGTTLIGSVLPSAVLTATSGHTEPWDEMLARHGAYSMETDTAFPASPTPDDERPAGWTARQERERYLTNPADAMPLPDAIPPDRTVSSRVTFVPPRRLKFALAAVALTHSAQEFAYNTSLETEEKFIRRIQDWQARGERMSGLRGILNEVDWLWPLVLSLDLQWDPDNIEPSRLRQIQTLAQLASGIRREPGNGPGRTLTFDLRRPLADRDYERTLTDALLEAMGGGITGSAFGAFTTLCTWQDEGLLLDLSLSLRKHNLEDVLLFDWLSDGERLFLGRMALFYLLRDQTGHSRPDALILLDEPETHFNDVWKREIVDIIDESLGDAASDAIITTHSSICLTDVFDDEIALLKKENGVISQNTDRRRSFGASPTDIMQDIFGATDTVGLRAAKFLDLVLVVAAEPQIAMDAWRLHQTQPTETNAAWIALREKVRALPHDYGSVAELDARLLNVLSVMDSYSPDDPDLTTQGLVDMVALVEERLGSGYYQFEFRRRLRALRQLL